MIAEENNARGIVDLCIFAHVVLEKDGGHRRNVLMAEAQVSASKASIAGLYSRHSDFASLVDHVPGKNLLGKIHRPCGAGALARVLNRRQESLTLHASHIEREQPAMLDHLPRNLILSRGELTQSNFFPTPNAIDEREVGRSQQPEVLAILLVDALDIFRDDHANPRTHLRVRRLLAARSLPAPFPADRANEPAALHVPASNRRHRAALQAEIRYLAQRLVKIKAIMRRSYLVGRNIVAQFGIIRWIPRIPWQVFAGQLPLDEFRIFGEKKNASLQPDFIRPLFNLTFKK